jgi:hypothetical protein
VVADIQDHSVDMKRVALIVVSCLALLLVAGGVAFYGIAGGQSHSSKNISEKAAQSLQWKIDAIRKAADTPGHKRGSDRAQLSEGELQSYVFYSLKDDIPAQLDSVTVQLEQDTVGCDAQVTFNSKATGNPVLDPLVGGTHNLSLKGRLIGREGRGKFDLQEVQVDGVPVPKVLIQALIKRYVKPKYPEVDLNEPFDLPWEIQEVKLESGRATVIY